MFISHFVWRYDRTVTGVLFSPTHRRLGGLDSGYWRNCGRSMYYRNNMEETALRYTIALAHIFRYRLRKNRQLLDHYGSAEEVWKHLDEKGMKEALKIADNELHFIHQHQISTYFYKDDNYPFRLRECPDAPILLYGKGNLNFNTGQMISVVGTRSATERGKELTRRLILDLGQQLPNATIISGLAYGIDVAAHRAALEAGLPTIIIPGHGLDRIYPALHRNVAVAALEKGGLLTEYPSGTEPDRQNFVARDRIIAGMADAVVVVESKEKGGSLITARMACDYNRELFAFPGRPNDEYSCGCNILIKDQQAALIQNADDLVRAMKWESDIHPKAIQTEIEGLSENLDEIETKLLYILREQEDGIHINNLVMETALPYSQVSSSLMMLEVYGWVKSLPGGMFRAVK